MPRKPKQEKTSITVVIDGIPVPVTLYPPTRRRKSWFAYWVGLTYSKSTGQRLLRDAAVAAEAMVRSGGNKPALSDTLLSDDEFDEIQRRHYIDKKHDTEKKKRSEKSFMSCMEAISAFRETSGLKPVTLATPDDCERFQTEATRKPRNWRMKFSHREQASEDESEAGNPLLSPNTVVKWSVALQAAFERANRNGGKKCVRGAVPEHKLLSDNPWKTFTWIEGRQAKIRQFEGVDLLAFLDYLEQNWTGITVAPLVAKTCLWSWGRKSEVMGLRWESLLGVGSEVHFSIVGKWDVDKWFRIPEMLFRDLEEVKTDSPFVFAAYNQQLRKF
jgi:hypothetical protein